MKQTLKNFNTNDTILVITSYPNPINGKYGKRDFNAIGEHAERRLPYLSKYTKVLVAAEKIGTGKGFSVNENLEVVRIWKKGNLVSLVSLLVFCLQMNKVKSVFVQFEFNVLGGIIPNLILLILLLILRLSGKQIVFEVHQVITDIGALQKHINITSKFAQNAYNSGLSFYYISLGIIANSLVVFEEELKKRLSRFAKEEKIVALSLSVDRQKTIPMTKAKKILGIKKSEFVLLQLGFINGYKGLDIIIPILGKAKIKNLRFIVGGGENPYLQDKPHYQKFYKSIVSEAKKHKNITLTGFIPDSDMYLYYSAADLVIMPYEVFMSASGPFSRAQAYEKPILLSEKLENYSKSFDFLNALHIASLEKNELFFKLDSQSITTHIKKVMKDSLYRKRLHTFIATLGEARSCEKTTEKLYRLFIRKNSFVKMSAPVARVIHG